MAESDDAGDLLKGLKLAVIALVSAVATAGLVIVLFGGAAREIEPRPNPHYGDLTYIVEGR